MEITYRPKEIEVLKLLPLRNIVIAQRMGVKLSTVGTYVARLMIKLRAESKPGLLVQAIRAGLINLEDVVVG
jgi:DNA-binding CsgD family transcriptional regulator